MAEDDARAASAARMREIALEVSLEQRVLLWDRLGFNVRTDAGIEKLARVLDGLRALGIDVTDSSKLDRWRDVLGWVADAHDASVTRNKRLLFWVTTAVSLSVGIMGLIKFYLDWRHP